jgi:putative transposase
MATATVLTSEPRLLRDRLQKAHLDPNAVPVVLPSLLGKTDRKRFDKLIKARDAFRSGCSMEDAAAIACVSIRRFERLLTRYLTRADDKRLSGERAFKRGWRVKEHPVRTAGLDTSKTSKFGAYTGAFLQLMSNHQKLRTDIVNSLRRIGKQALQTNHLVGRELRKMLVELYKKHGIAEDQYPMNTADKGLKALRRWIVTHFMPDYANDWIGAEGGPNAAKAITTPQEPPAVNTDYEVYQDFMLDECRVDLRTSMEIINKDGDLDLVEVECIRVLRLIELGYNSNVSYWIIFGRQALAEDIGELFWRAMHGWEPVVTVPDLQLEPGAGFPVNMFSELRWRKVRRVYLDNALSHLSKEAGVIVEQTLGGELVLGLPGDPKERPEIESKFSMAARRFVHQLPGTMGTGPLDPQRKRHEDLEPINLVRTNELEYAYYVMMGNENGSPSTAAHGIPSNERLRRALIVGSIKTQPVSLSKQIRHMFFPAKKVTVHASDSDGRKPYVNYDRVRYSSAELQRRYDLNNQKVWACADPDDLRVIILVRDDGTEICRAIGEGRWGTLIHDVRMRRMALRGIDKAQRERMPQDGPLTALMARLQAEAPLKPSAALAYAHCLSVIGRHVKGDSLDAEWLAKLVGSGMVLEAAAKLTPSAAAPQTANDSGPTPTDGAARQLQQGPGIVTNASSAPAANSPMPMQPRRAVRRAS